MTFADFMSTQFILTNIPCFYFWELFEYYRCTSIPKVGVRRPRAVLEITHLDVNSIYIACSFCLIYSIFINKSLCSKTIEIRKVSLFIEHVMRTLLQYW